MSSLILALHAKNRTKGRIDREEENRKRKRSEKKLSPLSAILTVLF